MLSRGDIDRGEIKKVGIGIVAVDFKNFGDVPTPRPALDLNHDMQAVADIALDGAVRQLDTTLQDTAREARKPLFRGACVDGGNRPRMARIQKLQEIKGFPAPDFAELRGGFACGWCEIKGDWLFLLAHPNSGVATRQFAFPQEADIVGRVTGIAMKIDKQDELRK